MKGFLFAKYDSGRGGPGGYISYYKAWCVDIDGKKHHIHLEVNGEIGFDFNRDVRVEPCNGRCRALTDVDEVAVRKALALIPLQMDHQLTSEEKAELPEELQGTSSVAELGWAIKSQAKDLSVAKKALVALERFVRDVETHSLLGWLIFRRELAVLKERLEVAEKS